MLELILLFGAFMVISLSGALSPGPLTVASISEGARTSRWAGAKLALGHGLVEILMVAGIAYGLGAWLRQPLVSAVVALLGAAVLLWMGYGLAVGAWRGEMSLHAANSGPRPATLRYGHIASGMVLTLFNPYWIIWWATVGAAYVSRSIGLAPMLIAIGGLFFVHWLTDLGWLGGLSLLAGSGAQRIGDRAYRAVILFCGLFLLAFGLYLAWSGAGFLLS